MLHQCKVLVVLTFLMCVTACSLEQVRENVQRSEHWMQGKDYDKEMAKKAQEEAEEAEFAAERAARNIENAKGFNFHNYDVIGFKNGVNKKVVDSFIQKNTSSRDEKDVFTRKDASKSYYYKSGEFDETVIIGRTGVVEHDTAYYITNVKDYTKGNNGPLGKNLEKNLFEKYGPPTIHTYETVKKFGYNALIYYWQFDKNGNLKPKVEYSNNEMNEYLRSAEFIHPGVGFSAKDHYDGIGIQDCRGNCGYQLSVGILTRRFEGMTIVTRYSITLADMGIYNEKVTQTEANDKKRRKEEAQKWRNRVINKQVDL